MKNLMSYKLFENNELKTLEYFKNVHKLFENLVENEFNKMFPNGSIEIDLEDSGFLDKDGYYMYPPTADEEDRDEIILKNRNNLYGISLSVSIKVPTNMDRRMDDQYYKFYDDARNKYEGFKIIDPFIKKLKRIKFYSKISMNGFYVITEEDKHILSRFNIYFNIKEINLNTEKIIKKINL